MVPAPCLWQVLTLSTKHLVLGPKALHLLVLSTKVHAPLVQHPTPSTMCLLLGPEGLHLGVGAKVLAAKLPAPCRC